MFLPRSLAVPPMASTVAEVAWINANPEAAPLIQPGQNVPNYGSMEMTVFNGNG